MCLGFCLFHFFHFFSCSEVGLTGVATLLWTVQTLAVGFPSMTLLRRHRAHCILMGRKSSWAIALLACWSLVLESWSLACREYYFEWKLDAQVSHVTVCLFLTHSIYFLSLSFMLWCDVRFESLDPWKQSAYACFQCLFPLICRLICIVLACEGTC